MKISTVVAAMVVLVLGACGYSTQPLPQAGEEYEIVVSYETSILANGKPSGSSRGQNIYVERVIIARDDGLELEYDLPEQVSAEDRARVWQFPVRVFRPTNGPMQLINREELETRVDAWLATAGLNRSACGEWIFTWNAFRIECDPETILETIRAFDFLFTDLREGTLYRDPMARSPEKLKRIKNGADSVRVEAVMEVDPDAVRRARAEADVVVGKIMNAPVTFDSALRDRAKEVVSGTIEVTFDIDSSGNAWRSTKVTRLEFDGPGDRSEAETATETVERRPVSARSVR